jgi:[acyl-carrier-protein] S-malonyltransferase
VKIAAVFPGQGSQHAGMGTALLGDADIADLCSRTEGRSGVPLRWLLTGATDDELRLTQNAQPALCFVGAALARLLARRGVRLAAAAGHSVGEYAALCAAAAVSAEDAIGVVVERGRAMAEAVTAGKTSMSAVLGIPPAAVESAVADVEDVWPANYNTPTQTVIGGGADGLAAAETPLRAAGARRILPLKVSAAFHTPYMARAASRLQAVLDRVGWTRPEIPVVANLDAEPYADAAAISARLGRQLESPVRWSGCVERLLDLGCDTFIELGPGRALTGMMRELAPGRAALAVSSPADVMALDLGSR